MKLFRVNTVDVHYKINYRCRIITEVEKDRQNILKVLQSNDRNGYYLDHLSLNEMGSIMSLDECLDLIESDEDLQEYSPYLVTMLNKYRA